MRLSLLVRIITTSSSLRDTPILIIHRSVLCGIHLSASILIIRLIVLLSALHVTASSNH